MFKVGDKVRIKIMGSGNPSDYMKTASERSVYFNDTMATYINQCGVITKPSRIDSFHVSVDGSYYSWHWNWLEKTVVDKIKVKDML